MCVENKMHDFCISLYRNRNFSPTLEKELTCVSCSRICWPPIRIYQCDEGDLLCENCSNNVDISRCPECHVHLSNQLSRNKALEKLARKHYQ